MGSIYHLTKSYLLYRVLLRNQAEACISATVFPHLTLTIDDIQRRRFTLDLSLLDAR